MGLRTTKIMGVGVSGTDMQGLLGEILKHIEKYAFRKPFFIITAYSENILESSRDMDLARAFAEADRIVADGVSILAACDYLAMRTGDILPDVWRGLTVGGRILRGKYAKQKIMGVKLARELLQRAVERDWKVYLLGGVDGAAGKLAKRYKSVIGYDEGYANIKLQKDDLRINDKIVDRINKYRPDILLVALGRFEQEKWIARNLQQLKTKVIVGVGSSFEELTRLGAWGVKTPEWVDRAGLKWLWRVVQDPKHVRRAWNAFPVFAWKIFRSR